MRRVVEPARRERHGCVHTHVFVCVFHFITFSNWSSYIYAVFYLLNIKYAWYMLTLSPCLIYIKYSSICAWMWSSCCCNKMKYRGNDCARTLLRTWIFFIILGGAAWKLETTQLQDWIHKMDCIHCKLFLALLMMFAISFAYEKEHIVSLLLYATC